MVNNLLGLLSMLDVICELFEVFFKALVLLLVVDESLLGTLLGTLVSVLGLGALAKVVFFVAVSVRTVVLRRAVTEDQLVFFEGFLEDVSLSKLTFARGFSMLAVRLS